MSTLKQNVICLENLTKQYKILNHREGFINNVKDLFSRDYKIINAVENISLNISEGEIIGFIGPNGAGKSTTIKMMTGVLEPTSGSVTVNGLTPYRNRKENAKSIGVVFGQRSQLWWDLPVIESYKILKAIYHVDDADFKHNLNIFNNVVDITKLYSQPARMLSLGQRMICDIFAAFLHNPKIVFLDEPTIGLDISVKASVREIIHLLNRGKGTTIVLTSHDLSDIESLSRRLVIIDHGMIIYDGSISDITKRFSGYRTLRLDMAGNKEDFVVDIREHYGEDCFITSEGWIEIKIRPNTIDLMQLISYVSSKYPVHDLYIQDFRTEEIIKKIYEGATI